VGRRESPGRGNIVLRKWITAPAERDSSNLKAVRFSDNRPDSENRPLKCVVKDHGNTRVAPNPAFKAVSDVSWASL
jgi:hypothetical protein